ncbi:MAG TPA: transcriptional regulator, partial [Lachnospiraceae bacterium]|nr:transcriptional regulator [Lachnospiraceae bacterium]
MINAICSTLKIKKEWLVNGEGEMEETIETSQSAKVLAELYNTNLSGKL